MAGFDYSIQCKAAQRKYLKGLLGAIQREASKWKIEYRYKWDGDNYYVTMDGTLKYIEAMSVYFNDVLPASVEFSNDLTLRERKAIVSLLVVEHMNSLSYIVKSVHKTANDYGAIPNTYRFDSERAIELKGLFGILSSALIRYETFNNSPSETAESIHTVLESLMFKVVTTKKILSKRKAKDTPYEPMAKILDENGLLNDSLEKVIQLKDMRKEAKHRNKLINHNSLNMVFHENIAVIHALLNQL